SAGGEVARAFLVPLAAYLRRKFPHIDPDLCDEAAGEAIFNTITRPEQYDPKRLSLRAFLKMAAFRDLQNLLPKETTRPREISLESVAEPADHRNSMAESDDAPSWDHHDLITEIASFNPTDRIVLTMMRDGERATAAFAPILGLSHLPRGE